MAKINVVNQEGQKVKSLTVSDVLFGADYNEALIHQVVVAQLANKRQGTKSTLTRTEVSGGGIKPYRQKGTGRARQGSIRAPQFVKGGVVFAPKPRDFSQKINKKMKAAALCSALSEKLREKEIIVVDALALEEAKTKNMVAVLNALSVDKSALIVIDAENVNVQRASKNIQGVMTTTANLINVYDVVKSNKIVMTVASVKLLEEVYAK